VRSATLRPVWVQGRHRCGIAKTGSRNHETGCFSLAEREIRVLVVLASKLPRALNCRSHRFDAPLALALAGDGQPDFVSRNRQEEPEMSAKRLTKAQVIGELAEYTELDKKSVGRVFDGLTELIKKELRKPNGEFVIPGLLKLRSIKKPATKDRPGINPFTKQPITIKGKPAQKKVRATALKALKDLIQ
jgi:nucleoid DNA-binding protein